MKKIKLFLVTLAEDDHCEKLFTVTCKRKQAEEYINKRIYIDSKEHFDAWCGLKGFDCSKGGKDFYRAWAKYFNDVIAENPPKYKIIGLTYDASGVALMCRIYDRCLPIGCSYDESIEAASVIQYLGSQLDDALGADTKLSDGNHKA